MIVNVLVKDDKIVESNNPVYLKIAMRLAYEVIRNYIEEGHQDYVIAPDGRKVTLPFAAKVVEEYVDAI